MRQIDLFEPRLDSDLQIYSGLKPEDGKYRDLELIQCDFKDTSAEEFNGCRFERVHFTGVLQKIKFIDCVFIHCDFSNQNFSQNLFYRNRFENCKGTGSVFKKSKFQFTEFNHGSFPLSDFSESSFENIRMIECNLSESAFQSCKQTGFITVKVDFSEADFTNTSFMKMDLSGCTLHNLRLSPHLLKGLTVDVQQAAGLASLLGIIIKD